MENFFCFIIAPILVFCFAFLFFWGLEEAEMRVGKLRSLVIWGPFAVGAPATIIAEMFWYGFIGLLPLLIGEGWVVLAVVFILLTRRAPHRAVNSEVGDAEC